MLILGNQQLPRTSSPPTHPPRALKCFLSSFTLARWPNKSQVSEGLPALFCHDCCGLGRSRQDHLVYHGHLWKIKDCQKIRQEAHVKKTMCTELINRNYSTFKSLHTRCSFQTCLIEEDKLAFAGAPNEGYKKKKKAHTRKIATSTSSFT